METVNNTVNFPWGETYTLPQPKELNCLGRLVAWIRNPEGCCTIGKVLIHAIAFFASIALMMSLVGIPLFILGYTEFVRQKAEAKELALIQQLCGNIIDENNALHAQLEANTAGFKLQTDLLKQINTQAKTTTEQLFNQLQEVNKQNRILAETNADLETELKTAKEALATEQHKNKELEIRNGQLERYNVGVKNLVQELATHAKEE